MNRCVFCEIIQGKAKSWRVFENQSVYAFFDIHPVNEYHTLVVPKKHYENIFDIPENELIEVIVVIKNLVNKFKNKLGIRNVQIINSSGLEAQQDIFHFHFHIVPREKDDQQDIIWVTHPEWVAKFDQLLTNLK